MLQKKIRTLSIIFLLGVSLIILAYRWSAKKTKTEFKRFFPPHMLMDEQRTDLTFNSYYIAGKTTHTVYLGNFTAPIYVTEFLTGSNELKQYRLSLPDPSLLKTESFNLSVNQSGYYLTNGNRSIIFYTKYPSDLMQNVANDSLPYFLNFFGLNERSAVLKTYNSKIGRSTLTKISFHPFHLSENTEILQKQTDGFFDSDGSLKNARSEGKLVYMYYYRNQFIVADTNLAIIYRGKMIDTNSTINFNVASLDNHQTMIMASPKEIHNKRLVLYNGMIFIESTLTALNEPENIRDHYAVIDVYALDDGHYRFSFYIPRYQGELVKDFTIIKDHLISLSGHFILNYHLNLLLCHSSLHH